MTILFVLVPLAMLLTSAAVAAFAWSVHRGQLDDLTTPALRMLEQDEAAVKSSLIAADRSRSGGPRRPGSAY
jgi:cbb3-type cytochrome oxidase maturation protein